MTELNLKGKIHWVSPLLAGSEYRTKVWISTKAARTLNKFTKKNGPDFFARVKRYATFGFENFESGTGPIKHEEDGVWRIGNSILFRLIGFYDGGKACFIVLDAFLKLGQQLTGPQKEAIKNVVKVKEKVLWRKKIPTIKT